MDLSSLAELGKVAGVAGIAIGMIVLLVRPMIDGAKDLPRAERAPMFPLVAVGAFAIGALGILAWLLASVTGGASSGADGNCSISSSGIASGGNRVNCGASLAAPTAKP